MKIKSRFRGKDTTLNNAVMALCERLIILSKKGRKGVYRFQHRGFALCIKFFADPDILASFQQNSESEEAKQ